MLTRASQSPPVFQQNSSIHYCGWFSFVFVHNQNNLCNLLHLRNVISLFSFNLNAILIFLSTFPDPNAILEGHECRDWRLLPQPKQQPTYYMHKQQWYYNNIYCGIIDKKRNNAEGRVVVCFADDAQKIGGSRDNKYDIQSYVMLSVIVSVGARSGRSW